MHSNKLLAITVVTSGKVRSQIPDATVASVAEQDTKRVYIGRIRLPVSFFISDTNVTNVH